MIRHGFEVLVRLPQPPPHTLAQRLATRIDRLVSDLEQDLDYVLLYWNLYRDKQPLLDILRHEFHKASFQELATLEPDQLAAVDHLFDEVDQFRLWATYTEAMPATLERRYQRATERIRAAADLAMPVLGGVPEPQARPTWPDGWTGLNR